MRLAYSIYEKKTGRILRVVHVPEDFKIPLEKGQGTLKGQANDAAKYVKRGKFASRPELPVSIDGSLVSGIPDEAQVIVQGQEVTGLQGELLITAPVEGHEVPLEIHLWPYQSIKRRIVAAKEISEKEQDA